MDLKQVGRMPKPVAQGVNVDPSPCLSPHVVKRSRGKESLLS